MAAKDFSPLPMTHNSLGAASQARQPAPTRTPAQDLRFLAALRPSNDMVGTLRPRRVGPQVGAKDFSPLPMTHNPLGSASQTRQPAPTRTPAQDLRFLAALRPRNDMVGALRPRRVGPQVGAKDFSPPPMTHNPLGAASQTRQPAPTRTPAQDLRFLAALRPRNDRLGRSGKLFSW